LQEWEGAARSFGSLLEQNEGDAVGHFNLACALQKLDRAEDAIVHFRRSVELAPQNPKAHNNLGTALFKLGRLDQSIAALKQAVKLDPAYLDAFFNLATSLKAARAFSAAISICEQLLRHRPDDAAVVALIAGLKLQTCDFNAHRDFDRVRETLGIAGVAPPFVLLHLEDHPRRQQERARTWAAENFGHIRPATPQPTPGDRLRVGYFSVNFSDHANLYLTSGMFAHHDRAHFEINAYALAGSPPSALRDRLASDVSAFHELQGLSEGDIAALARKHQLDIAIDLDGYTHNARTGIFAHRAAPVQIGYLGFPGTTGAGFFDYIVADEMLVPPGQRGFYDEKILFMPHSYQPTDDGRAVGDIRTRRADFGLPEHATVICCFNNSSKIGPAEFDIWMRVLGRVDNAVLWLLESNASMRANLKRAAQERGIAPRRLHFARRVPQERHLERHRHADIFADTFNYNAHTTASDALWSGLPLLTRPGQQFASRVAASLLWAVGLPELIADTHADYEEMLMHYATDADARGALKSTLAGIARSSALFDTAGYTRDLEAGLQQIALLHRAEQLPRDIEVSRLAGR